MSTADWKAIVAGEVPGLEWLPDASCGVAGVSVPELEAVRIWSRLVDLVPRTRRWPVVIGGADRWDEELDRLNDESEDPGTILKEGLSTDFAVWSEEEIAGARADAEINAQEYGEEAGSRLDPPHGTWPDGVQGTNSFSAHLEGGDRRGPGHAGIALIPTSRIWEAPAYLRFGGWNACPTAEVQVAAFKSWHERFGAEVFAIAGDTVEMSVTRPPLTREGAIALALEQYVYCADVVDQGTQTIERLAAELLGAPVWFFWWD